MKKIAIISASCLAIIAGLFATKNETAMKIVNGTYNSMSFDYSSVGQSIGERLAYTMVCKTFPKYDHRVYDDIMEEVNELKYGKKVDLKKLNDLVAIYAESKLISLQQNRDEGEFCEKDFRK